MSQLSLLPAPPADALAPWNGIQARYRAYCLAHGAATPDEMLDRDRVHWPGGVMAGYIDWIGGRWAEWRRLRGRVGDHIISLADHADFDAWLEGLDARPGAAT